MKKLSTLMLVGALCLVAFAVYARISRTSSARQAANVKVQNVSWSQDAAPLTANIDTRNGDGAYRDGFYLGQLDAQNNHAYHPATGRWSSQKDRQAFLEGYNQAYPNGSTRIAVNEQQR